MEKASREYIAKLLETNDLAVERAMVVIFLNQTEDEQRANDTKHRNKRGFNASDAKKGSSFAKTVLSGQHLPSWHLPAARRMAKRYIRQLVEAAKAKKAAAAAAAAKA